MRTPFEIGVLALLLVGYPLFAFFVWWPRWRGVLASGEPGSRPQVYTSIVGYEWLLSGLAVAAALSAHRAPADLGLVLRPGLPLWSGFGICAALAYFLWKQAGAVARKPAAQAKVRAEIAKVGDAMHLLPRTPGEMRGFAGLSLTAGICEELLWRGYAAFVLSAWMPAPAALLLACVSFGFSHSYQGPTGATRAGLVGVVMSALYLGSGSIVPPMLFHAILDVGSGLTVYLATRDGGRTEVAGAQA